MKVGIITQYYGSYNFGGNLQAFALQKVIDQTGFLCELICYNNCSKSISCLYLNDIKRTEIGKPISRTLVVVKYLIKCFILRKDFFYSIRRRRKIFDYSNSIPHSQKIYDDRSIKELNDSFDCFIVGSDCVWHQSENPYVYSLVFSDKRKLSYAASLGSESIPNGWTKQFLDGIRELDAIAVREKSIAKELQNLIPEKKVYVTVDPTLLLSADEWAGIIPKKVVNEKYALIYILSEDKEQCLTSQNWVRSIGLKSYTFPHIHNIINYWQRDFGDIRDFTSGPLEFVSLIKNAEIVITDSFHAVVFSTIFHKPFYALAREKEKAFVGRVENYLEEMKLTSQLVSLKKLIDTDTIPIIDFENVDRLIEEKKEYSLRYLIDNLLEKEMN